MGVGAIPIWGTLFQGLEIIVFGEHSITDSFSRVWRYLIMVEILLGGEGVITRGFGYPGSSVAPPGHTHLEPEIQQTVQ